MKNVIAKSENSLNIVFSPKKEKIVGAFRILLYAPKQSSLKCEHLLALFACIIFLKIFFIFLPVLFFKGISVNMREFLIVTHPSKILKTPVLHPYIKSS